MRRDGSFSAAVARQTDSSFYVALKEDISFLSSVGMQSDDLCEGDCLMLMRPKIGTFTRVWNMLKFSYDNVVLIPGVNRTKKCQICSTCKIP